MKNLSEELLKTIRTKPFDLGKALELSDRLHQIEDDGATLTTHTEQLWSRLTELIENERQKQKQAIVNPMNKNEALALIGLLLGGRTEENLLAGLPGGLNSVWDYDEKLIIDIGEAVSQWQRRSERRKKVKQ